MSIFLKKRVFLSTVLALALVFVFSHIAQSIAGEMKPIREITLSTGTKTQIPIEYEEAFVVVENWEKLGLKVRVEPVNFPNPLIERMWKTREFDAWIMWFTSQVERLDPDFYIYNAFHSSNASPGGWNISGFINKDFDQLAEAQRTEYDLDKRKAIVHQCQQFLYKENPWLVMLNQDDFQAYNKARFKDPVIPKIGGFKDPFAFFTIKPTGERKVIRLAEFWAGLKTINPLLVSESSQIRFIMLIYDMLVRIGPDTKPQLWAAETINPIDQKTIDVSIRTDLKFHDGQPLTGQDVKFTFDYMIKHKAPYFHTALDVVKSVDVLDRFKVRFHLKKAHAPFISQSLAMIPLLPKHIWEKIEKPTEYRNLPPIGSGPFKFDYWREGQEFKMSRFADHFKAPYVDGVLLVLYGTREACFTALVQKETDVVTVLLPHQMEELKKYDYIQTVLAPSPGSDTLMLNCRRKPFDDPKFRLALAYTIPRRKMLSEFYSNYGSVGGSVIAPVNRFWADPKIKPYPFDLEKARDILKQAGYRWDKEGRLCYPPE